MRALAHIEGLISRRTGFEHTVLTGNGTTALFAILAACKFRGKRIAIPDNTCPSVLMAVLFSGNLPLYLDIDPRTGCVDATHASAVKAADAAALIYPYMYGQNGNISEISRLCKRKGWVLIEDFAQAFGVDRDRAFRGDACVLSFGAGKTVEAGHGGAAQTNSAPLRRAVEKALRLHSGSGPRQKRVEPQFSQFFKFIYNHTGSAGMTRFSKIFNDIFEIYRDDTIVGFDHAYIVQIRKNLEIFEHNRSRRLKLTRLMKKNFEDCSGLSYMSFREGSVPWRFNIFLKQEIRDIALKELLRRNLPVSSWYIPLSSICPQSGQLVHNRVAERYGATVLNLWVNHQVDEAYCQEVPNLIRSMIKIGSSKKCALKC